MKKNELELISQVLKNDLNSNLIQRLKRHDFYSFVHSRNVAYMTAVVLSDDYFQDFSIDEKQDILRAAMYHDIGKLLVPSDILQKRTRLQKSELDVIKTHCQSGKDLCFENCLFTKTIIDGAFGHHERCDGSGYPQGLHKRDIPITAKIIAVVDVFDSLRSERPYKKRWSDKKVYEYFSHVNDEKEILDKDIVRIIQKQQIRDDFTQILKKSDYSCSSVAE